MLQDYDRISATTPMSWIWEDALKFQLCNIYVVGLAYASNSLDNLGSVGSGIEIRSRGNFGTEVIAVDVIVGRCPPQSGVSRCESENFNGESQHWISTSNLVCMIDS